MLVLSVEARLRKQSNGMRRSGCGDVFYLVSHGNSMDAIKIKEEEEEDRQRFPPNTNNKASDDRQKCPPQIIIKIKHHSGKQIYVAEAKMRRLW